MKMFDSLQLNTWRTRTDKGPRPCDGSGLSRQWAGQSAGIKYTNIYTKSISPRVTSDHARTMGKFNPNACLATFIRDTSVFTVFSVLDYPI